MNKKENKSRNVLRRPHLEYMTSSFLGICIDKCLYLQAIFDGKSLVSRLFEIALLSQKSFFFFFVFVVFKLFILVMSAHM